MVLDLLDIRVNQIAITHSHTILALKNKIV